MHLEWYQWRGVAAALVTIVVGAVRLWVIFTRKRRAPEMPTISQRGKFNQNIVVNGGSGSPKVDVHTNIRSKK